MRFNVFALGLSLLSLCVFASPSGNWLDDIDFDMNVMGDPTLELAADVDYGCAAGIDRPSKTLQTRGKTRKMCVPGKGTRGQYSQPQRGQQNQPNSGSKPEPAGDEAPLAHLERDYERCPVDTFGNGHNYAFCDSGVRDDILYRRGIAILDKCYPCTFSLPSHKTLSDMLTIPSSHTDNPIAGCELPQRIWCCSSYWRQSVTEVTLFPYGSSSFGIQLTWTFSFSPGQPAAAFRSIFLQTSDIAYQFITSKQKGWPRKQDSKRRSSVRSLQIVEPLPHTLNTVVHESNSMLRI